MDGKKKVSKSTARAQARNLLLTERAILLGRLQVLEVELQRFITGLKWEDPHNLVVATCPP